jgi:hypothetical protein
LELEVLTAEVVGVAAALPDPEPDVLGGEDALLALLAEAVDD